VLADWRPPSLHDLKLTQNNAIACSPVIAASTHWPALVASKTIRLVPAFTGWAVHQSSTHAGASSTSDQRFEHLVPIADLQSEMRRVPISSPIDKIPGVGDPDFP